MRKEICLNEGNTEELLINETNAQLYKKQSQSSFNANLDENLQPQGLSSIDVKDVGPTILAQASQDHEFYESVLGDIKREAMKI